MDLHPTLEDILNDFLYCEMACVVHQAAELEVALKLHQALMKCAIPSKPMIIGCAMGTTFRSPFIVNIIFVVKPFPPSLIEGGTGFVAN